MTDSTQYKRIEAAARAMCDAIGVPQEGTVFIKGQMLCAWESQMPKAKAALAAADKVDGGGWRAEVDRLQKRVAELEAMLTLEREQAAEDRRSPVPF